jgi:hypothetical protein
MTTSVAVKPPCRTVTTTAITLSGEQTVNGVAVVTGDRVLVKDQADTTENGIYVADTSAWSRAPDFDGSLDAVDGTLVLVHNASGLDQLWELTATNPVIIGSSALVFTQSSLTASAFGASLIAAVNAAAARALLGATTVGDAVFIAASAAAARTAIDAQVAGTYVGPGAITGSGLTMATARLLGRTTGSTGAIEEISMGAGLSLVAGVLSSTAAPPDSSLQLNTSNGYGSTSTVIRRFTNVAAQRGSYATDFTIVMNATVGTEITINTTDYYTFSYTEAMSAASPFGLSLNSAQLTTQIANITLADRLVLGGVENTGGYGFCGGRFYLPAGSVVRPHANAVGGGTAAVCQLRISRG